MKKALSREFNEKPIFEKKIEIDGETISFGCPQATRAMIALMDMEATIGGAASHYGGPAAFAELMSAVHALMFTLAKKKNRPWDEVFNFVNDAGHCENGLYALKANYQFAGLNFEKLKGFRSISSPLTGHGEVHLFPEGVLLSNGPLGSAFPQAQGLAIADAIAKKDRLTLVAISDGGCMEGEAREAFASLPGLAKKGLVAPFVLVISDNNTKLTGRIDQDSFSMSPTFASLKSLGWNVIDLPDGHDLKACYQVLKKAFELAQNDPHIPIAIHARTIKGIGHSQSAESKSGGHGFSLKNPSELPSFLNEIFEGASIPSQLSEWVADIQNRTAPKMNAYAHLPATCSHKIEKIQVGVSRALTELKQAGHPIVSVTSDLPGSTGVQGFRTAFPEASLDVGVAESNMISIAAGLSKQGLIPVVDTFAQFGVTKGALPLTMANLSHAPVVAFYSHTGFQDAADGASHQALSYLAMTMSIPNVRVFALTCSEEAYFRVKQEIERFESIKQKGQVPESVIFFLGRENFPSHFGSQSFTSEPQTYPPPDVTKIDLVILGVGSLCQEALVAQTLLAQEGISALVMSPAELVQFDPAHFARAVSLSHGRVAVLEDHQSVGGFAQHWIAKILQVDVAIHKFKHYAVPGVFGQSAYSAWELYKKYGLDGASVANRIKEDFFGKAVKK